MGELSLSNFPAAAKQGTHVYYPKLSPGKPLCLLRNQDHSFWIYSAWWATLCWHYLWNSSGIQRSKLNYRASSDSDDTQWYGYSFTLLRLGDCNFCCCCWFFSDKNIIILNCNSLSHGQIWNVCKDEVLWPGTRHKDCRSTCWCRQQLSPSLEDVPLVEFMYPVFTCMPGGLPHAIQVSLLLCPLPVEHYYFPFVYRFSPLGLVSGWWIQLLYKACVKRSNSREKDATLGCHYPVLQMRPPTSLPTPQDMFKRSCGNTKTLVALENFSRNSNHLGIYLLVR